MFPMWGVFVSTHDVMKSSTNDVTRRNAHTHASVSHITITLLKWFKIRDKIR